MANTEVDESLYSRQLYVYGHEAQKKLQSSSVLLINAAQQSAGLAIEIAKNVILAGVHKFTFMDNNVAEIADLGAQFYLTEADVGKSTRAQASIQKLSTLNPYVKTAILEDELSPSIVSQYSVVCLVGATVPEQIRVNDWCRLSGSKFIAADSPGMFLSVFVDDGDSHVISDADGQECKRGLVAFVSQGNPGIVTLHVDQRHGLNDGQYVTFDGVEGMTELNGIAPQKVRVVSPFAFSIGDTSAFAEFTGSHGHYNQVKVPETVSFAPLRDALAKPAFAGDYMGDAIFSHAFLLALSQFRADQGRLPAPDSLAEADAVLGLMAVELGRIDAGYTLDEAQKAQFRSLARAASAGLSPVAAVGGGFVGQEILKAISGKFTPIQQFYYWSDASALPALDDQADMTRFRPRGSRYDAYVAALGADVHEKLAAQRLFLVGAGAIGCEMLKGWAMMGVATGAGAGVTVTDMDTIEKSNLNRQFLFRAPDVGKLKSAAAAAAATVMNPAMQVTAHSLKVAAETESTYDDSFWSSLSGVYTALDNVDARLFVDDKCVYHRLPMVDSGTLGTAGNTQVVVPGLTESYGSTRDPPEESIPICTLKNFPFKIEHTIQWARDVFEGDFRQPAEEANRYLSQPDYLAELRKQPNALVPTLRTLRAYLATERPKTFAECIAWARRRFDEEFDHKIRQLLITFPPDARTTEGTAFWSGTKRAPTPITFDAEDPTHMGFVVAAANLHAFNFNLRGTADVAEFRRVLRGYTPAPFEARAVKVATTEAEAKRMAEEAMTDADADAEADQLVASLPAPESMAGLRLSPVEFEKDDDSNHHIAYITACSNLRARNYAIREEDAHQTKFIAGKIIPAIATTTALVTGLVCVEMLKLAQRKPLEAYRNSFVSLATNVFTAMDPIAPETTVTVDGNGKEWRFSLWDKVEVDLGREPTMGEVVEELKQRYNCDLSMLTFGNIILYMDIGVGLKQAMVDRLQMPITKAVEDVTKEPITSNSNYMMFETSLSYENDDGEEVDIEVPAIRVKVK